MKASRDLIEVESTVVGDKIRMGLSTDAEDQVALQSIMIDMYEDRIMAPSREYSTNAWDAHVEAGCTDRAIEVSLPSALSPSWRVRDFGLGLDHEAIRDLYSLYGKSTKRGTNSATGMLGIGCKSALTYTSQFSVVSVKNGRKVTVSVTRSQEGGGDMMVLQGDVPTDEEQGTEIVIPVNRGDHTKFADAADKLFRFWPEGSVLVNGQEPAKVRDDAYRLSDELYVVTDGEPNDWVVMGNVPYPVDLEIYKRSNARYDDTWSGRSVVAFVPIGDIDFTPAREALQQTTRTLERIEQIKSDFKTAAAEAIGRDVKKATTKYEAFVAYWEAASALELGGNRPEVKFKGKVVPEYIKYATAPEDATDPQSSYRYRSSYRRNSDDIKPHEMRVLPLTVSQYGKKNDNTVKSRLGPGDLDEPIIWVTNFFPTTFNADQRRRLDAYRSHKGLDEQHRLVLVKAAKPPMPEWMEGGTVWDWKDIRKWVDPNATKPAAGGSRKLAGSYYVRKEGTSQWHPNEMLASDLPKKDLFFTEATKYRGHGDAVKLIRHTPKAVLVVCPATRVAKFKRDFPYAIPAQDALASIGAAEWDKLSNHQKLIYFWRPSQYATTLSALVGDLKDPDLAKLVEACKEREAQDRKALSEFDNDMFAQPSGKLNVLGDSELLKRYPILNNYSYRPPSGKERVHLVLYMNAAYAEQQKEDS
jgi:hypothetical protein